MAAHLWNRLRRHQPEAAGPPVLSARGGTEPTQRYFTDGSNLYRFVGWLTRSGNARLTALEDCRTLRILLVSSDRQAGLRPVA